jgi:carboxyl-terminal processing protease
VITAADGRSLAGMERGSDLAQRLLKGAPGSPVRLLVRSVAVAPAAPTTREVVVVRQVVRPPGVFVRRVGPAGRVGVIHVTEFAETTHDEFDAALNGLLAQGMDALVLDLRDNTGGVLTGAVHVVDRFLAQGAIVRIEGRVRSATRVYSARPVASGPDADVPDTLPLAVLVNGYSASASEVVAGALQDHRRALLVGERTFGKFLVQQITEAPRGDCAVQLVTSRYYTPLGRSYQRKIGSAKADGSRTLEEKDAEGEPAGLLPDVVQALDEPGRERLEQLWSNQDDRCWAAPTTYPDVPESWVDAQLQRALEALQGELVARKIRAAGR